MMEEPFRARVAAALGVSVVAMDRLGGGDVAESFRLSLRDGRIVFAKTHRRPPPGFFTTEANGLVWLREAAAVPVPEVLAVDDGVPGDPRQPGHLVLEWIDQGRPGPGTEAELGRQLAALHQAGAPHFGRADRRSTGSRGLPNEPTATWVDFYRTQRLEPLRRLATEAHALPAPTLSLLDACTERLSSLGVPDESPARLHGDLWAGNRLVDRHGRSWLIDPAAHGGHREFDLAMMELFGGFGPDCFAAYDEVHPLAEGWVERIPVHQLAPLIVHAIKFGGGYAPATHRTLEAALRL